MKQTQKTMANAADGKMLFKGPPEARERAAQFAAADNTAQGSAVGHWASTRPLLSKCKRFAPRFWTRLGKFLILDCDTCPNL
jgi:hypothetical protein